MRLSGTFKLMALVFAVALLLAWAKEVGYRFNVGDRSSTGWAVFAAYFTATMIFLCFPVTYIFEKIDGDENVKCRFVFISTVLVVFFSCCITAIGRYL
jgi:hypothetical protein